MTESEQADLEVLNAAFRDFVPHNRALGLEVVSATLEPPAVVIRLPWDERWVGNPETGVPHGGVVSTLIDATSGAAVYLRLREPIPIATLDLRIDYLRPASPNAALHARAECYRATHNVAFVRAIAYHQDPSEPVAAAAATFMISTPGKAVVPPEAEAGG
ncbi:MAG: PaaI family thioesterase [Myxococcales bacterium]|nr:PaaI family thioesterase [Myxococcales bacterium]